MTLTNKLRQVYQHHTIGIWLLLAWLLPIVLMGGYFAYRGMAPFGPSSLLTVDLGQQYIDFFAYLRRCLLHDPSQITYSFSKALGGEMVGTWAYYLMSPFNLLLLAFPGQWLPTGVTLITLLKYGFAGLSFAWLLTQSHTQRGMMVLPFSTAYAMMGWTIANQLNLMWLDALIWLPLIVWGVHQLIQRRRPWLYVFSLAAMLVVNYYMAYMICLFIVLYGLWLIVSQSTTVRTGLQSLGRLGRYSLLSAMLAAWLLVPTFWALTQSKGQYTVTHLKWQFEFFAPKMLAKFFLGAFNFDQMPSGTANLFVGSLGIVGFLFYFFQPQLNRRTKIGAALMAVLLGLSLCYQPLDLLWHAGQFPVWYPYRFSFVIGFWMLWLAAQAWQGQHPSPVAVGVIGVILVSSITYVAFNLSQFKFLTLDQVMLGSLFVILALAFYAIGQWSSRLVTIAIVLIFITETTANAIISLDNIAYVSQSEFASYTRTLQGLVTTTQHRDTGLYRIAKTFMRTKGDPLQTGYNGGSVFSSTFEPTTPAFMGHIGQPDGDGFVAYTNGTAVTDALLGMKYVFGQTPAQSILTKNAQLNLPQTSTRADLAMYPVVTKTPVATIYRNPQALSLGIVSSANILRLKETTEDPTQYQANWLAALTGNAADQHLFSAENFDDVLFNNVKPQTNLTGAVFQRTNLLQPASLTFKFTPTTNDSYYLTFGQNVTPTNATFTLNGQSLAQYSPYRHTVTVNVANHDRNRTMTLKVGLKKGSLWLQNFTLYRLNNQRLDQATQQLKRHDWQITTHRGNQVAGRVSSPRSGEVLSTTIPYSAGWQATVDGRRVPVKQTLQFFSAIRLPAGTHQVDFTYHPPFAALGWGITGSGILLLLIDLWWRNRHAKRY